MFPLEPLMNCSGEPKKNLGVSIVTELPLSVVSSVLNIFRLPFEPLIKLSALPKLKAEELSETFVPSNFTCGPDVCPMKALGVPPLNCNCIPVFPNVALFIVRALVEEFNDMLVPLFISSLSITKPPILPE